MNNRGEVDLISSVSVPENLRSGYKCQASVRLKGIDPPYPFSFLVPSLVTAQLSKALDGALRRKMGKHNSWLESGST